MAEAYLSKEEHLLSALVDENMDEVRRWVEDEGADPSAFLDYDTMETPIQRACEHTLANVVRYFVEEREADVTVTDEIDNTLLHDACRKLYSNANAASALEIVKILVKTGEISLDAENTAGSTPLHSAATSGLMDVVQYLVEQGANVNKRDDEGKTPLFATLERYDTCNLVREDRLRYHLTGDEDDTYMTILVEGLDAFLKVILYFIPRTRISEKSIHDFKWATTTVPWGVKELLIENFLCRELNVSVEYWNQVPIHLLFRVPFGREDALFGVIDHYVNETQTTNSSFALMQTDDEGRLPIHVAGRQCSSNRVITPSVILKLWQLEPKSALVRDPTTGFHLFQMVVWCREEARSREWDKDGEVVNLLYELVRANPSSLLTETPRQGDSTRYASWSVGTKTKRQKMAFRSCWRKLRKKTF